MKDPKTGTIGTLINDRDVILVQWAAHLSELFNCIHTTHPTVVMQIPQFKLIPDLDSPRSFHEVATAIKNLKNNKAAGHWVAYLQKPNCRALSATLPTAKFILSTGRS